MPTLSERNRRDFPKFAAWVDELTRVFGPVKVKWCVEGDKSRGNVPEECLRKWRAHEPTR